MKIRELLNEKTYELRVGQKKDDWRVVNRFTDKVEGSGLPKEKAQALADELNAADDEKQKEFYRKGNRGMMMGDVHMDWKK